MSGIDSFSDELLSRWIAEKLGWTLVEGPAGLEAQGPFWKDPEGSLDVNPPDMITDPAMTLLLQKQLIAQGKRLHYAAEDGTEYLNIFDEHDWKLGKEFIGSLERTTAEAFALAKGWKPE